MNPQRDLNNDLAFGLGERLSQSDLSGQSKFMTECINNKMNNNNNINNNNNDNDLDIDMDSTTDDMEDMDEMQGKFNQSSTEYGGSNGASSGYVEDDKRKRRAIANSNERRRMQSINAGFQTLKSLIPHSSGEKLSKVNKKTI